MSAAIRGVASSAAAAAFAAITLLWAGNLTGNAIGRLVGSVILSMLHL